MTGSFGRPKCETVLGPSDGWSTTVDIDMNPLTQIFLFSLLHGKVVWIHSFSLERFFGGHNGRTEFMNS